MQYDRPEIADVWEVFGTLQCKVRNLSLVLSFIKKKEAGKPVNEAKEES